MARRRDSGGRATSEIVLGRERGLDRVRPIEAKIGAGCLMAAETFPVPGEMTR